MFNSHLLDEIIRLRIEHDLDLMIPDWVIFPRLEDLEASSKWLREAYQDLYAQYWNKKITYSPFDEVNQYPKIYLN